MFNLQRHVCLAIIVLLFFGCSSTPTKQPTEQEIDAALAQQRLEKHRAMEKRRAEEKAQQKIAKSKIDIIVTEELVNLKKWDFKTYFGSEYTENPRGEFETKEDYINRFKSMLNPSKAYYFEVNAKLSSYDMDNKQYMLLVPATIKDAPTLYQKSARNDIAFKYINPKLARFDYDSRGEFIWIPLKAKKNVGTYTGKNSYGAKAEVIKTEQIEWGLAAIYNKFSDMAGYGYDLSYKKGKYDFMDALALKIPVEEAKNLDLKNNGVIVRVGVKFSYGVGPLALSRDIDLQSPTITSPVESKKITYYLGVDLDSVCLLRRDNKKILSCRLHLK